MFEIFIMDIKKNLDKFKKTQNLPETSNGK